MLSLVLNAMRQIWGWIIHGRRGAREEKKTLSLALHCISNTGATKRLCIVGLCTFVPAVHHQLLPAKQAPGVHQLCLAPWHQHHRPPLSEGLDKRLPCHLRSISHWRWSVCSACFNRKENAPSCLRLTERHSERIQTVQGEACLAYTTPAAEVTDNRGVEADSCYQWDRVYVRKQLLEFAQKLQIGCSCSTAHHRLLEGPDHSQGGHRSVA